MNVNSVTSGTTANTSTTSSAQQTQNEFLKLLITQIQNQNPLEPMDNAQFTTQLAQLSTLEQLQGMNDKMDQSIVYTQSLNNTMMLGLVGREAVVAGDAVNVADGAVSASHIQSAAPGLANVTVKDENGTVVASYTQAVDSGWNEITWDGRNSTGEAAPDGAYTIEVSVLDTQGAAVSSQTYMSGMVESIRFENNLALLNIGGHDYYASEIARVGI